MVSRKIVRPLAVLAAGGILCGSILMIGLPASGQSAGPATRPAAVRIGVYDSRAVALAWGRSAKVMDGISKASAEGKAAQTAGNDAKFQEIRKQMERQQFVMHAQVFSNYPPEEAMAALKTELPKIAREAGVSAIVNRLDFQGENVETVDLTEKLANYFEPTAETKKMVESMRKAPKVDLYTATHEEQ